MGQQEIEIRSVYCNRIEGAVQQKLTYGVIRRAGQLNTSRRLTSTYCSGHTEGCENCFIEREGGINYCEA